MNHLAENILSDIRHLLLQTGDGGRMGPAIYDTAQLLRHCPPPNGSADLAYEWLLSQQRDDGGWGEPDYPLQRDAPTMAALLALNERDNGNGCREAIKKGCDYLKHQPPRYADSLPDEMPVGVELILPYLSNEAAVYDFSLPRERYAALFDLGAKRLSKLRQMPTMPTGSPALHCWESWGEDPGFITPDAIGSIANSPSSSAVWVSKARQNAIDIHPVLKAQSYLKNASAGTGLTFEGVVPTSWPIDVFEVGWMLYTLALAGLLKHPALRSEVTQCVAFILNKMSEHGVGASDTLCADGDDTAVCYCVLSMLGYVLPYNPLQKFRKNHLFITYPGEQNYSLSTVIHALHALRVNNAPMGETEAFLEQRRNTDGVWEGDKWHVSWLYSTCHAIYALSEGNIERPDGRVQDFLLKAQHTCGGWGSADSVSFEETAYAILILRRLCNEHTHDAVNVAVNKAYQWMCNAYSTASMPRITLWIAKELFCPQRIVRMTELAGLWIADQWHAQP